MSENTRWQEFNSIIDNEELDLKGKLLLLILFRYVDNKTGYSHPSLETIKNLMGYSHTRYVIKNINELIQKEYLIKETVKQRNRYYILSKVQNVPKVQNVHDVQNVPNNKVQKVHNNRVQNVPTKRKGKENKENIYSDFDSYTENEELKTALKDFSEMRKAIKKPLTTKRAITMLINKLDSLASTDEEKKLILEQSIFNNWQGVFELKKPKQISGQISINDDGIVNFERR